jgi:hypothetical protein
VWVVGCLEQDTVEVFKFCLIFEDKCKLAPKMPHEIIFREQYGTLGEKIVYIKPPGRFLTFIMDIWIQEDKRQAWQLKSYPFLCCCRYNESFIGLRVCFVVGLIQFESWCAGCPVFFQAKSKFVLEQAMMLLSLAVSLLFPLKINIWLLYRVG